jgi:hypothetical protein
MPICRVVMPALLSRVRSEFEEFVVQRVQEENLDNTIRENYLRITFREATSRGLTDFTEHAAYNQ